MKRIAIALTLVVAMLSLVHAPEVLGGAGQSVPPPPPTSGPAINATIVTDTTSGSPTLGRTSVRLSKGSHFSAATFVHSTAGLAWGQGWHRGCDSVHGVDLLVADQPGGFSTGADSVETLTDRRFLGKGLGEWITADILTALFDQPNVDSSGIGQDGISGPSLGIDLAKAGNPMITDIDNPVCTEVNDGGTLKYILSFTAVIQFEK